MSWLLSGGAGGQPPGAAGPVLPHDGAVVAVALSPDGGRLLTVSGPRDAPGGETAQLWDVGAGRRLARLGEAGPPVTALAFSPDGARLAVARLGQETRLYDARDGRPLGALPAAPGRVLALSLAGAPRQLVATDAGAALVPPGKRPLPPGPVAAAAFSPDGAELLIVGTDGTARLFGPGGARALPGRWERVRAADLSREGAVLTVGWEGPALLRDRRTGAVLRALEAPFLSAAAVARDGRVALAGLDGAVRLVPPERGADGRAYAPPKR